MTDSGAACAVQAPAGEQGDDPGAAIAGLRERGAQGFDPVRLRFLETLARRASALEGDTRRVLDRKLVRLLSDYEERFEKARSEAGALLDRLEARFPDAAGEARQLHLAGDFSGLRRLFARLEGPCQRAALTDLVGHLARQASELGAGRPAPDAPPQPGPAAELKTLTYFRSTWARLSVDRRLNQSLAKVPENAGPLNSHGLALRSLKLMRDISPHYLHRFMSHLDALLWLDQVDDGGVPAPRDAARADGDRKQKAVRRRTG